MTKLLAPSLALTANLLLRQIKAGCAIAWEICGSSFAEGAAMPVNVGTLDQYVRIVLGLALIAYAFQDGLAIQGWHWVGLLGVVPLVTAFFRKCPLYVALGISSCPVRQ